MPFRRPERILRVRAVLTEPSARFLWFAPSRASSGGHSATANSSSPYTSSPRRGDYRSGGRCLVPTPAPSDVYCVLWFPRREFVNLPPGERSAELNGYRGAWFLALPRRCNATLHATTQHHGYESLKQFKAEIRCMKRWYRPVARLTTAAPAYNDHRMSRKGSEASARRGVRTPQLFGFWLTWLMIFTSQMARVIFDPCP